MYAKTTELVRKGSKYTEVTEWHEINTELYQAYLDYIRSVANILFKDSIVKEYQVFVEKIELIQSEKYSNKNKLILVCRELLDLGIDTVNKY